MAALARSDNFIPVMQRIILAKKRISAAHRLEKRNGPRHPLREFQVQSSKFEAERPIKAERKNSSE